MSHDEFALLRQFTTEQNAAGTMFLPADLEDAYNNMAEERPGLPPFEDVKERLLLSREWGRTIAEVMSEAAYSFIEFWLDEISGQLEDGLDKPIRL